MRSMIRLTLAALLLTACAHDPPPPPPPPAPKQPNLSPEAVRALENAPTDAQRIQEIQKLDQENEEKNVKVASLEKTVAELQEKLEAALHGSKDPAPKESSSVGRDVPGGSKVRVELQGELVFFPGSARISAAGMKALNQVAGVLKTTDAKRIEVIGHSDSSPSGHKYEDNWQLSAERARRVVAYLFEKGVDGKHMVASGYADTEPLDTADTGDARRKNRRVEIFIEPK
jgi:chemotaxis protein MotB